MEHELNEWDARVGDGDCGTSVRMGELYVRVWFYKVGCECGVGIGEDVGGCEHGFRFGFALGFLLTGFGFGLGLGIGLGFGCNVVSESRYALLIDLKTEVDCGMHETSWLWSDSKGSAVEGHILLVALLR
jgi:hypothetical protein